MLGRCTEHRVITSLVVSSQSIKYNRQNDVSCTQEFSDVVQCMVKSYANSKEV